MLFIDAAIRFSALGFLLLMTVVIIRDLPRSSRGYLLLSSNFLLACFLLGTMPTEFQLPHAVQIPFRLLDTLLIPVTWFLVLTLFHPYFRLSYRYVLVALLLTSSMLAERMVWLGIIQKLPPERPLLVIGLAVSVVIHMLVVILSGRTDDLIERRRRYRLYFVVIISLSILIAIFVGSIWLRNAQATTQAMSVWLPIASLTLWLVKGDTSALAFYRKGDNVNKQTDIDKQWMQKLDSLMQTERLYCREKLSVKDLATALGVAEHKLRALINKHSGYSNFSHYINSLRVDAVVKCLESRKYDHLPILTLALNHGFNSLPPFNRAFKSEVGLTPSQFRKNLRDFQN